MELHTGDHDVGISLRTVSCDRLTPAPLPVVTDDVLQKCLSNMSKDSQKDAPYHEMKIDSLARKLETDLDVGLSSQKAAEILERDGPNELYKPPQPSLLKLFLLQLTGFIIVLLMVAAVASIIVNATGPKADSWLSYTTGVAIMIIVFLNAGIAAWTEHQAGGALEALAKMSQASIDVLRDGKAQTIATNTVVRGDIILLGTGDVVPADARLFVAEDLKVSEMCLTGEPDDVTKTIKLKRREGEAEKLTPDNMVFSGCSTTNGKAHAIVTETGMGTRIGQIAALMAGDRTDKSKTGCAACTNESDNQTPLQKNISALGAKLGVLALVVCFVVFVIGVIIDTRDPENQDDPSWLYMILIAVTLAVAAIPEGIPLCVTISLSIGCTQMVKKNVLVRKLAAVETLGSASVICSDKTGTLTEGKMTMVEMWSGGVKYDVTGKGFDPNVGKFSRKSGEDANTDGGVKSSLMAAMLCCNTTIEKTEEDGDVKYAPRGNSSEAPIIVAGMKLGLSADKLAADYKRVLEVPFSSSRKMMLTVSDFAGKATLGDGGFSLPRGSQFLTVCKGAPNYILDICSGWTKEDGSIEAMTDARKKEILSVVDEYSVKALRVLAIAVRPMGELPYDAADEDVSTDDKFAACRQNLTLLGLVASIDPEREGVKESVATARGAGIRVVMITGDYLKTAVAIGKNVGILAPEDDESICAVDCASLRPNEQYLPALEIDKLTMRTKVFARAKPEDKLEIVKSLQRQHLVSAMTGDGVNDAPALNQADIGVAMGIQGTEVAKGASDMILRDDNFCSIVSAVERGRVIYAGIQKFVAFIMSVHIAEVIQIFVCIVCGIPVMRTPLQILFLILVTDLPPSIALGKEPGDKSILDEPPRPKKEPIVLGWMWASINMNGIILSAVIIAIYIFALIEYCDGEFQQAKILDMGDYEEPLMKARTVAFISLVYAENVRAYIARSFEKPFWHNLCGNPDMQKAIFMAQICLYLAVFVPVLSTDILKLDGLAIGAWGWAVSFAGPVLTIILCELAKIITKFQVKAYNNKVRKEREEEQRRLEQAVKGAHPTLLASSTASTSNEQKSAVPLGEAVAI
eukprot:TRINITY_DN3922_c0_g1_i1.p1 TRINITY_DN3922_c0_g1~~TRINITY_DN3922_c0_g1_i1.p1  ORF type:complete len:1086 (+),score=293.08 TRINITY_DN3922_c0_g1_i1:102-3359(+)